MPFRDRIRKFSQYRLVLFLGLAGLPFGTVRCKKMWRQSKSAGLIRKTFDKIFLLAENTKYDQVPYERMFKPVKEIYRAWTKVASGERSLKIRDILTFILQEDDGYRFRVQWLVTYFNPNKWWMRIWGDPIQQFEKALFMTERAEVIGDMKDKIKLLKTILMLILKDESIKDKFLAFCKEVDWNKVKLSKADKYHFRGKYFKVDYQLFDY